MSYNDRESKDIDAELEAYLELDPKPHQKKAIEAS